MSQLILSAFMITLALVSGGVWWRIDAALREKRLPLVLRDRGPAHYHPLVVATVLVWLALQFSSRLVADYRAIRLDPDLDYVQRNCASLAATWCILLGLLYATSRSGLGEYGIRISEWKRSLRDEALGFASSVLPVFLVLIVTLPLLRQNVEHAFFKVLSEQMRVETVAWIVLAVLVLAPLAEELIFRVTLQGWLETRYPPGWAIGLSAAVFAGAHGWPDALPLLPLAAILGYVYWRTHSYLTVVVVHSMFNGMYLIIALLRELPDFAAVLPFAL